MSRLDALRLEVVGTRQEVRMDQAALFVQEEEVVEKLGELVGKEMEFFGEWDDRTRVEVLDEIRTRINVKTMKFRVGHDVLGSAVEMLSRVMGVASEKSPIVAAMAAKVLARLARTYTGFLSDGMRDAYSRSCRDVLASRCKELVCTGLRMIGKVASISSTNAAVFVPMSDRILDLARAISEEYERPPTDGEADYDRKSTLTKLNPALFAFREIVKWHAAMFDGCIKVVFQRVWMLCSVYREVLCAVEACIRIFTDLLVADIPGVFEMFDECCVLTLASELVMNCGPGGCVQAGLHLIRCVYAKYPVQAAEKDCTTTPEMVIGCCRGDLSLRIEAWRCLTAMVKAFERIGGDSPVLNSLLESSHLLSVCSVLETRKFDELVAILELIDAVVPLVDASGILQCLDVHAFIKASVHFMESDSEVITVLCIDILGYVYERLLRQGLASEYFLPAWKVSRGNEILDRIVESDESERCAEQANALMRMINES